MKRILISAFSLLVATATFAQVDRSIMPKAGPAPKIEIGKTESFTLDNGLQVFVVENNKLPKVSFSLVLDIGGIKEGDKAGTADLAGDLMKTGTTNRTKDEINSGVDFIGATLHTSAMSVYGSSLTKHEDELLDLMSDVVKNAKFSQDELDKLKKQYKSNIKSTINDPDAIASNVRKVLLFGKDHPYGEIMTEETVDNITLDDTKNYYSTYYKPNVAYLAVVGDITLKKAKPLIKKYFGDWKKGPVVKEEFVEPEKPQMPQLAFVNKPGAVQSVVSVFNTVDLKPGSPDAIPASVANSILGGGFTSKLNLNLREEHAFTYGARSALIPDELIGRFYTSTKVRNEVTDSALTQMLSEIMNMRKGDISADELNTIKNYKTGTFAYSLENPQTKARFAINIAKYDLPKDYYETYLEKLAAVTIEDVDAVSKKYFDPMHGYILVVGNKDEVAEKLKKFSPSGKIEYYDAYGNEAKAVALKPAPANVSAKSVIDHYLEAIGGVKNINKVKSIKVNMSTSMQGMPITITSYHGAKGEFLSTVEGNGMVYQKQVFDGSKGMLSSPQGSKAMDEEQLAAMKEEALIFPEMHYGDKGYKLDLKGIDTKNGKEAYALEITDPNGDKQTNYYAVDNGLLVFSTKTIDTPMGSINQETTYSDYKKVGKVMYPYSYKQETGPQEMELKVESVEINPTIDQDLFKVEEK